MNMNATAEEIVVASECASWQITYLHRFWINSVMSLRTTGTAANSALSYAPMEAEGLKTRTFRAKSAESTAAGQPIPQGESLLAARRLRRRRQKHQAPFKRHSEGALYLIPTSAGDDGSVGNMNNTECPTPLVNTLVDQGNLLNAYGEADEKNGGEYIMKVITSCLEAVLTMSSDLQIVAKYLFGSYSFHDNAEGEPGQSSHVEDPETHLDVGDDCASVDSNKRLEAVLTYLRKADSNAEQIITDITNVATANMVQGLTDRNRKVSEQISQRANYSSCTKKDTVTGFRTAVDAHNKISPPERSSADGYQEHTMTVNSVAAQENISKMKSSCQMMLQCMKSVVQILNLALEANRIVQRAVKWVATREYEVAEGIVAVVSDTAGVTSQSTNDALSEAENAVLIHKQHVKAFAEMERSFCNNQVMGYKDNTVAAVDGGGAAAAADNVEKLVRQTSKIRLDQKDQDSAVDVTNVVNLCLQNDSSKEETISSSDEIPSQASHALLRAAQSSLFAVDSALTVLEILSVYELQPTAKITEP